MLYVGAAPVPAVGAQGIPDFLKKRLRSLRKRLNFNQAALQPYIQEG